MTGQFYRIEVKESGKMTAAFDLDPALISVASLKLLVETETGLGPASQRLVYRGRILKDEEVLSTYIAANDKSGVLSIFMNETKREDEEPRRRMVQPKPNSPDFRAKAMGPIANVPHDTMMSKNPELLEKMFMSNPEVQAMVEKNPQLRQALSDPKTLQDMFNMSTNKAYYQEAMRGHDRALSNLENIPQGFQHLVQMQKTMKDAEGARLSGAKPTKTSITGSEPSREITKDPFPNPWQPTRSPPPSFLRRATPLTPELMSAFDKELLASKQEFSNFLASGQLRPEDLDLPIDSEYDGDDDDDKDQMVDPSSAIPTPNSDVSHYAARYHKQLSTMKELGFTDENENIRALLKTGGNMSAAIEWLVSRKNL